MFVAHESEWWIEYAGGQSICTKWCRKWYKYFLFQNIFSQKFDRCFLVADDDENSSCAVSINDYLIYLRDNRNVTNRTETPSESLITVSLPVKLHTDAVAFQQRSGLTNLSKVIRHALESYSDSRPNVETIASRQVSFRVPSELRTRITRQAKNARVSVGRIVRMALQALPSNPTTIQNKEKTMAKKKAAKKATKKATKSKKK